MVVPRSARRMAILLRQRLLMAAKARGYIVGPRFMARSTVLPALDKALPSSRHADMPSTFAKLAKRLELLRLDRYT